MNIKLYVVRGKPRDQELVFPRGDYLIGRGPECHVRLNSPWVSRQHCLLLVGADTVDLQDLGSMNGTLVNGTRLIGLRRLAHGDQVQIGPLTLAICLESSAAGQEAQTTKDAIREVETGPLRAVPETLTDETVRAS